MYTFHNKRPINKSAKPLRRSLSQGFTLVEVLVSLALFTVVALIAVGTLFSISYRNTETSNTTQVMDSMSFVLQDLTREVTLGQHLTCGSAIDAHKTKPYPCDADTLTLEALDIGNMTCGPTKSGPCFTTITYRLEDGVIEKRIGSEDFQPLTAKAVHIDDLNFHVTRPGTIPPMVRINLTGSIATSTKAAKEHALQTTVASWLKK